MTQEDKKILRYQMKIMAALDPVFNDKDNENYIGLNELGDGDNMTLFIHALANAAPNSIMEELTAVKMTNLEFNHTANKLCFQYSKKIE